MKKKKADPTPLPAFTKVKRGNYLYLRAFIYDSDGKRIAVYGKNEEELAGKILQARKEIEDMIFRKANPTVSEYCERWLEMQAAHVRPSTLRGYTLTVRKYIIAPLGEMYLSEVTTDDIKLAMVPVSKRSEDVYNKVNMLFKSIFYSAEYSNLIKDNPAKNLNAKGGIPKKEKEALTDAQAEQLLDTIKDLPPYVFVMIGLYSGLRREEILALQWDSVFLDCEAPYLTVRRAWHTENNRPIIMTELKTKAAHRDVPLPDCLVVCLREAKKESQSQYVISNADGNPLSYTQFKRLWQYIVTRTAKERTYYRYENGERVKHTIQPKLGEKAAHNGRVTYTLDFDVTPHLLRHTYITNLIFSGATPKTVQYLAGHESSKITMDIYAKVKYNTPEELAIPMTVAFDLWND